MRALTLLILLLTLVLVAGPTLCPPDTDDCFGSLVHAFVAIGIAGSLTFVPLATDRLRPELAATWPIVFVDPITPPPRG